MGTVQCDDHLVNYFVQLIVIGLTTAEQCGVSTHSPQLGASEPCHITKRVYYIPIILAHPFDTVTDCSFLARFA